MVVEVDGRMLHVAVIVLQVGLEDGIVAVHVEGDVLRAGLEALPAKDEGAIVVADSSRPSASCLCTTFVGPHTELRDVHLSVVAVPVHVGKAARQRDTIILELHVLAAVAEVGAGDSIVGRHDAMWTDMEETRCQTEQRDVEEVGAADSGPLLIRWPAESPPLGRGWHVGVNNASCRAGWL